MGKSKGNPKAGAARTGTGASQTAEAVITNLQAVVSGLVQELGVQEGYELADTVEVLQAEIQKLQAEKVQRDEAEAAEAAKPQKGATVVAKRSCITSRRGVLGAGAQVVASDLAGGADSLKDLTKRGILFVVK